MHAYSHCQDLISILIISNTSSSCHTNSIRARAQQGDILRKNIISSFASITFGLIIGFLPFLQGGFASDVTAIGIQEALVLFLIGIGIGNLNDGISKLWERGNTG